MTAENNKESRPAVSVSGSHGSRNCTLAMSLSRAVGALQLVDDCTRVSKREVIGAPHLEAIPQELRDVDLPAAGDGVDGLYLGLRGRPLATAALAILGAGAVSVPITVAVLPIRRLGTAVPSLAVPTALPTVHLSSHH